MADVEVKFEHLGFEKRAAELIIQYVTLFIYIYIYTYLLYLCIEIDIHIHIYIYILNI